MTVQPEEVSRELSAFNPVTPLRVSRSWSPGVVQYTVDRTCTSRT